MKKFTFFENSGKKIKKLAKYLFFIEIIASIISGIAISIVEEDGIWLLLIPALILIVYILNLFYYAFGEIVDNSIHTNKTTSASEGKFDYLPEL